MVGWAYSWYRFPPTPTDKFYSLANFKINRQIERLDVSKLSLRSQNTKIQTSHDQYSHKSFDVRKILVQRQPHTYKLFAGRFSANWKQLFSVRSFITSTIKDLSKCYRSKTDKRFVHSTYSEVQSIEHCSILLVVRNSEVNVESQGKSLLGLSYCRIISIQNSTIRM